MHETLEPIERFLVGTLSFVAGTIKILDWYILNRKNTSNLLMSITAYLTSLTFIILATKELVGPQDIWVTHFLRLSLAAFFASLCWGGWYRLERGYEIVQRAIRSHNNFVDRARNDPVFSDILPDLEGATREINPEIGGNSSELSRNYR